MKRQLSFLIFLTTFVVSENNPYQSSIAFFPVLVVNPAIALSTKSNFQE
jgi:hypothetical protein